MDFKRTAAGFTEIWDNYEKGIEQLRAASTQLDANMRIEQEQRAERDRMLRAIYDAVVVKKE